MAEEIVTGLRSTVGREHPLQMVELLPSGGGIFEVTADGEVVFSKKKMGRHPRAGEVLEILRARL